MAARSEKILNAASTTLDGSIDNVTTSIVLTDGSIFPLIGDYRLGIESNEIVKVTSRSGNTLTVVRGVDGTSASSHPDGGNVRTILTQEAADRYIRDFVNPLAFSAPPDRLLTLGGAPITKGDFTGLNLNASTVVDDPNGSITLNMGGSISSPDVKVLYKSAPNAPYKVTAHLMGGIFSILAPSSRFFLGFRESSSGKLSAIRFTYRAFSLIRYYTSPNSVTGAPSDTSSIDQSSRADYWLQIEHDSTDLFYRLSADGYNWWEHHTEDDAFWFDSQPDQVWWGGTSRNNDGESVHLLAWIEENGP